MDKVKFLVIRFSSIGDIVLTTPLLRCLKNQVENSEIHFLTKKQYKDLTQNNPYIYETHLFDTNLSSLIKKLKNEKFDYIIDLQRNIRSFRIKSSLPVISFSFDKLNIKKWMLVNFKVNKLPQKHIVDRYLDTVKLFDVIYDDKGLDYFISLEDENSAIIEKYREGYIALVIGAKHFTKQIPVNKAINICKHIKIPVILLGSKDDYQKADTIKNSLDSTIINYCGELSINQSAFIIKKAKIVITSDTGLMHIAAAYKKDIVSLWGNTVPEFGMYPFHPGPNSKLFEIKTLKCRPCSKIGFNKCPKKHFKCMNDINDEEISSFVNRIIK